MTAVEWLINELKTGDFDNAPISVMLGIIEKALEMEKEQIKFFFEKGHLYSGCPHGLNEIYNKTYNNEQGK